MTEIATRAVLPRVLLSAAVVVGVVAAAAPAVADPAPPSPGHCRGHYWVEFPTDHAMPPLGTLVPDPNLRAPEPTLNPCR